MNSQYIDITWLTTFGLSKDNVLDYFCTSPFYDANCNNEIIRTQGVSVAHLTSLTGLEYALDMQNSKDPHLFIIRKQLRRSPRYVETKEIFYCLEGIIYQCPLLLDLLKTRIAKISYYLSQSFNELENTVVTSKEESSGTTSITSLQVKKNPRQLPDFSLLLKDISSEDFGL